MSLRYAAEQAYNTLEKYRGQGSPPDVDYARYLLGIMLDCTPGEANSPPAPVPPPAPQPLTDDEHERREKRLEKRAVSAEAEVTRLQNLLEAAGIRPKSVLAPLRFDLDAVDRLLDAVIAARGCWCSDCRRNVADRAKQVEETRQRTTE